MSSSAPPCVVRGMEKTDLATVMAIEKAAFSSPWTLATFTGLLGRESTRLWVAESDGRVVGYAVVWVVADQAELGDIAVWSDYRGRGIGTALLLTAIEEMRQMRVRELFLEVRVSNEGAQRLYARHGFEAVGRRAEYYSGPREDALVLRLSIPDRDLPIDSASSPL